MVKVLCKTFSNNSLDISAFFEGLDGDFHKKSDNDSEKKASKKYQVYGNQSIEEEHARLATMDEFSRDLIKTSIKDTSDLPIGGVVVYSDEKFALYDPTDSHNIVISSTGSRKTTLVVIPSLYTIARAGECAFIADPKGEIYDASRGIFEMKGYRIVRINMRDLLHSTKWNPLTIAFIWYNSDDVNLHNRGETMLFDFVKTICPIMSKTDPYWDRAGQNALIGAGLILFRYCKDLEMVNMRSLSALIRLIIDQDEDMMSFIERLRSGDTIKESLEAIIKLPDSTRHCVTSFSKEALAPYTTQDAIASLLSEDEIHLDKIVEEKTVVFITTPDERSTYNGIVSCFIKQSYEILINYADSCKGHTLPRRVNYVIDEFASFPEIINFDNMISAARSRNIRFLLILQGLKQLYNVYGFNIGSNIWGNCSNTFFLTSREDELLESIVKLGGKKKNGDDLFTTAGLQRLNKENGECIIFHNRCHPFISRFVRFDEWEDSHIKTEDDSETECRFTIPKVFEFDGNVSSNGKIDAVRRSSIALEELSTLYNNSADQKVSEAIGILKVLHS